jgi:hypothetical protein
MPEGSSEVIDEVLRRLAAAEARPRRVVYVMKRTHHKRVSSPRRRALEIVAADPDGYTEALLAAENIPAYNLIELVSAA